MIKAVKRCKVCDASFKIRKIAGKEVKFCMCQIDLFGNTALDNGVDVYEKRN